VFVNGSEDTSAVDARTGKIMWSEPGECFSCPLGTDATSVYIPTASDQGNSLRAHRRSDGKVRWNAPMSREANDGAAVAGGVVYMLEFAWHEYNLDKTYSFTAHAATSGGVLWETPLGDGKYLTFGMPAIAYGSVFTAVPDGTLRALDTATGAVRWSTPLAATDSSPAIANGVVYAGAKTTLFAFAAADGKTLWSAPLGATSSSSPIIAGGSVYIGDDHGVVHAFRRKLKASGI
jgi:eukaryotic-like serine/threonine-protein kinase